ncbi:MAG: hypothetical protein AB1330_10350 [Bacillota bacterium]
MRKLLLFSVLLTAVLTFAALPAFASTHPPCQWVQVDADNDPGTPPISVYGYWADVGGTQTLIVCDPKTGEPIKDADGKGIAFINQGQYTETEIEVLDKYEQKQVIDWEHPKEVRPLQLSLFAPNVVTNSRLNLEDIQAHGGVWAWSTGDCLTWGQGNGRARLLTNDPDDWLFVVSVTNPNSFPVSGNIGGNLWGWFRPQGNYPISIQSLSVTLQAGETKYVLLNRGFNAKGSYKFLAEEPAQYHNGSPVDGFSLAYLWSRNVEAGGSAGESDFPDILKPAKGFCLADPNWVIYPDHAWPMRFGVYLNAYVYVTNRARSDYFKGYVWMDQGGEFHVDPNCTTYPYRLTKEQIVARVENWFNSHKVTDIPLVCWYGGDPKTVDGLHFDYCRPAAYWWPDKQGAYASWWEQPGPVLVGPEWEDYQYVNYYPAPAPKWSPDREQNLAEYRVFGRDYRVGERTLWWASDGGVPKVLPVVKAELMFVHRYSWIPLPDGTGLLKKDVVPGYNVWISSEAAPKLQFLYPLKRIVATRYQCQGAKSERSPYGDYRTYIYWLATTWVWEPGKGWVKTGESTSKYENGYGQPTETWGRRAFFVRYPGNRGSGAGITPAVWKVRVDYSRLLTANSPGYVAGEFSDPGGLVLYDVSANGVQGSLYNTYTVWYGAGPYDSNNTPAVADLNVPGSEVAVPPVQVEARTTVPKWQQDCTASVTVARLPEEDPNVALSAFLSAVQGSFVNSDAAFVCGNPQFVLRPGLAGGWSLDDRGNVVPTEWIKGFGSVNWAYVLRSGNNSYAKKAVLGCPEGDFTRYSYFRGDGFLGYVALPGDIYLSQVERATVWPIRPLSSRWNWRWPFIDPWPVWYQDRDSKSWQLQQ